MGYRSVLLFCVLGVSFLEAAPLSIRVKAPHAILINAKTGKVLFEKNAKVPIYPASTTKIATVLYMLDQYSDCFDEKVVASIDSLKMTTEKEKLATNYAMPPHLLEPDGVSLGILKNETFLFKDLLYGALLTSANDACNVLVNHLSEDFPDFASNMTQFLANIGCLNTNFSNSHGLAYPEHTTTAYDMAIIAMEAIKNPVFRDIVSRDSYLRPRTNLQRERLYYNSNKLLIKNSPYYYPKAFGIKTGYTRLAKYNLVAAAENDERTLIAVLHKCARSEDRFLDAIKMFEEAFNEEKISRLLYSEGDNAYKLKVKRASSPLVADFGEDVYIDYFPSEEPEIRSELKWNDLSLPILKGSIVGFVTLYDENGVVLKQVGLKAVNDVNKDTAFVIMEHVMTYIVIYTIIFIAVVIGLVYFYRTKKSK